LVLVNNNYTLSHSLCPHVNFTPKHISHQFLLTCCSNREINVMLTFFRGRAKWDMPGHYSVMELSVFDRIAALITKEL